MKFYNVNEANWVDLKDNEYFRTPEGMVVDEKDRNLLLTEEVYEDFIKYIKVNKNDAEKLFKTFVTNMAKYAKEFNTRRVGTPIGASYKEMLIEIDNEIQNKGLNNLISN